MGFGLSTNWEMELLRADLVRLAGPERAARLEPQYPRGNPSSSRPATSYAGEGDDLAEQIAARARVARPRHARDRLQQLGRVGRALGDGQAAARVRPAPDLHRSRTSGTRPTSPATTTACAAPPCRPTRSPCSARPSMSRTGLHERDGRHPGPVRRAAERRRRAACTSSRASWREAEVVREEIQVKGRRRARGARRDRHPPRPDREARCAIQISTKKIEFSRFTIYSRRLKSFSIITSNFKSGFT